MLVKDLKKRLADLPDDLTVVARSFDHSYSEVHCCGTTVKAIRYEYEGLSEYYGEPVDEEDEVIDVLIIDAD